MAPHTSPPPAAPTAGQAGDDDVEEADDGADDGLQDGADAVDDGHEAGADGLEDGLDLVGGVSGWLKMEGREGGERRFKGREVGALGGMSAKDDGLREKSWGEH
ncbi:hypothetical protein MMC34_006667 [Xylographa carneopallida]|nr:hypothetical protein [Xylographa carneopallida]